MVRNEAERYLPSALDAWGAFASEVVVLDDGSIDGSGELAAAAGASVVRAERDDAPGWGEEWRKRAALWDAAVATKTDWVFVLDADMVPAANPSVLWTSPAQAVAFRLYDLWSPRVYREDEFWAGHRWPRVWAVRPAALTEPAKWPQRSVHCGHFPSNLVARVTIIAPTEMSIMHYGYADARDRVTKQEQYCSVGRQLSAAELLHAESIGAEARCLPVPFNIRYPLQRAS